jgi:hypothetical protein
MRRKGMIGTWLVAGLLTTLVLPGCGPVRPVAPAAVTPEVAAQAKSPDWSALAITDAVVTCSEIEHDRRPVGFHLSGHLPTGESVTLFYNGMEPVAPGTADVDVPDDAMIAHLRALRGRYELQVSKGHEQPHRRSFAQGDRTRVLAAVQRTIQASPVGRNPLGQSVKVVLAFIETTLKDAQSGQE